MCDHISENYFFVIELNFQTNRNRFGDADEHACEPMNNAYLLIRRC